MIEVDAAVQRVFDSDLESYRGRMDAITTELRESQRAIAEEQQRCEESFAARQAELTGG